MINLKDSLAIAGINVEVTETPAGLTVQLEEKASDNAISFITELATSVYGMVVDTAHEDDGEEVASSNTIHLVTKDSPRYAELAANANESSTEDDEIFEEEEESDEAGDKGGEEGEDEGDEDEEEIEELEDRDLKILVGAEHHKMAMKIYSGLCNNQNMARFPGFTIDFDQFLQQYYVRPPVGSDFDGDDGDFGPEIGSAIEEAIEAAQPTDIFVTSETLEEVAAMATIELAKRKKQKNGRAGFLSTLMKLISGDDGDSIIAAFDAGDTDKLKELMTTQVIGKLKASKSEA